MTEHEMQILKDNIRKKYELHRIAKPGKYPALKFNSYPAPYEHLRTSFREELTSHGQADMQEALTAIPSAKTWAKIFHEGYILKDEKVLNACYLYVRSELIDLDANTSHAPILPDVPTAALKKTTGTVSQTNGRNLLITGLAIGIGMLIYVVRGQHTDELVIKSPTNGMVVPRIMIAKGKTSRAGVVWLVIHPVGHPEYYVQSPIKTTDDGTWEGPLYTGNRDPSSIGVRSQLRAFVNPVKPILEDQVIYAWPKAELSSGSIDVIRGAQDIQPSTP